MAGQTRAGRSYRDYANDAVFAGDSLFVPGASFSYGPDPINLVLLKYSGEGELLWNRTYWEGGARVVFCRLYLCVSH